MWSQFYMFYPIFHQVKSVLHVYPIYHHVKSVLHVISYISPCEVSLQVFHQVKSVLHVLSYSSPCEVSATSYPMSQHLKSVSHGLSYISPCEGCLHDLSYNSPCEDNFICYPIFHHLESGYMYSTIWSQLLGLSYSSPGLTHPNQQLCFLPHRPYLSLVWVIYRPGHTWAGFG